MIGAGTPAPIQRAMRRATPACSTSFAAAIAARSGGKLSSMPRSGATKCSRAVRRRRDEGIGVAVDRGVQHRAAEAVAIRAEVGAAAGQPQAQRHAGANGVCIMRRSDCRSSGRTTSSRLPPVNFCAGTPAAAAACRSVSWSPTSTHAPDRAARRGSGPAACPAPACARDAPDGDTPRPPPPDGTGSSADRRSCRRRGASRRPSRRAGRAPSASA